MGFLLTGGLIWVLVEGMNWLDLIISVILLTGAVAGWLKGGVRSVILLLGLVVGVYLAGEYYGDLAPTFNEWIDKDEGTKIAAFASIFLIVLVISLMVATLAKRVLEALLLGWADRTLGLVIGTAIPLSLITAFLAAFSIYFSDGTEAWIRDSILGSLIIDNYAEILGLLPG